MRLDRPRHGARLRATLVATVVAFAAVLAIVGAYSRAPKALLGIAFERACAAERDMTDRRQSRLRVEIEDAREDADEGLAPASDGLKAGAPPPEGAAQPVVWTASLSRGGSLEEPLDLGRDPGAGIIASDPPTRGRAKLMVFLN